MYSFPFHHAITYNLTHIIPLFSFNLLDTCKDCVVEGSAKCQTIFKPNHQIGMKTMMCDVSQVVSYSSMMKGKGILPGYNCPSLHITLNIILGPISLNLDLSLSNWFIWFMYIHSCSIMMVYSKCYDHCRCNLFGIIYIVVSGQSF